MNRIILMAEVAAVALVLSAADLLAGTLTFQYRDAKGQLHNVTNMRDVSRLVSARDARGHVYITDYKAYHIFKKYLEDVQSIKDRVNDMGGNITVTVNSSLAAAHDPGSWSTGSEIQIQTWDSYRAISTLAHEVAHSYMKDKCGKNPTQGMTQRQKYGKDEAHYGNEVTHPKTALSEGYAEYHGDVEGGGQERAGCAGSGSLKNLIKEGPTGADHKFKYEPTKWKDVASPNDMWACEGINATMLRDMAKYVPNGAAKIEELMCQDTLQDVIKAWVAKYPADTTALARIVDANTNYTMDKEALRALTGANDYIDKERAGNQAKYKGKDPCDSLKRIFKANAGAGGGTGGGLPSPAGGAPGGGTGPALKKFE